MRSMTLACIFTMIAGCQLDRPGVPLASEEAPPCNNACAAGEVCAADGTCQATCGANTDCGGVCVDTDNDARNCGSCGNACIAGQTCDGAGMCEVCASELLVPIACETSAPGELTECERLYDGNEFNDPPSQSGVRGGNCNQGQGSNICVFDDENCANGCVRDVWIRFDLGTPKFVERVRYLSDWWSKRPDEWEIWVSDDPAMTPDNGAVRVTQGTGEANPWQCIAGESCADEAVPDACCPNGREQPQDTTDVGTMFPKYDLQAFTGQQGRYWYYMIGSTRDRDRLLLFEFQLFGSDCVQ